MRFKLKKIVASKTLNAFLVEIQNNNTISKKIFFGNNEYNDVFTPVEVENGNNPDFYKLNNRYNKNCLYCQKQNNDKTEFVKIYNMYDSITPNYKSAIYKVDKSKRVNNTNDFHNIFNHRLTSDLINIVLTDNIIYSLENKTKYGRYNLDTDINYFIMSKISRIYPRNTCISTIIYDRDYIETLLLTNQVIDPNQAISDTLTNIEYNSIYEINGNIYNDYESGNLAANVFKSKNQFNTVYDMQHDENNVLKNARDYFDIDKCGNQVYLKYKSYINYTDKNAQGVYSQPSNTETTLNYQNIEMFNSINRYETFTGHKSNLYSIAITTDILDYIKAEYIDKCKTELNKESFSDMSEKDKKLNIIYSNADKIIENIELEIKNCIRNIVESIQPAYVQLYNIYLNKI